MLDKESTLRALYLRANRRDTTDSLTHSRFSKAAEVAVSEAVVAVLKAAVEAISIKVSGSSTTAVLISAAAWS